MPQYVRSKMAANGKLGRGRNEGVFRRVAACGLACVSCSFFFLVLQLQAVQPLSFFFLSSLLLLQETLTMRSKVAANG